MKKNFMCKNSTCTNVENDRVILYTRYSTLVNLCHFVNLHACRIHFI